MYHDPMLHPERDTGLYVHVPFCRDKCAYCHFYSQPMRNHDGAALVSALLTELDHHEGLGTCRTVYVGGGSPTVLPPRLLLHLIAGLIERLGPVAEFTLECHPGQVSKTMLGSLKAEGVTRLSFGAQSFHQGELDRLGRRQYVEDITSAIHAAREAGFHNMGLDLIFAIPGSSLDTWQTSLEQALALGVQHISTYSLSIEPGTPLARAIRQGHLRAVDESLDRAMYDMARDTLEVAGLEHYEISNFARPGFQCQHNLGYWDNRPFIGIGPSAASYWQGRRTTNVADIGLYMERVHQPHGAAVAQVESPGPWDTICETAVLNLRLRAGIQRYRFRERTGVDPMTIFQGPIARYVSLGLLSVQDDRISLTPDALPIADSILCDFAAIDESPLSLESQYASPLMTGRPCL